MAKATAISFSFTPHIHSGKPSSKDGGFLHLLAHIYLLLLYSVKNFFPRHIGTVFDKDDMYNVVKERKTTNNHNILIFRSDLKEREIIYEKTKTEASRYYYRIPLVAC